LWASSIVFGGSGSRRPRSDLLRGLCQFKCDVTGSRRQVQNKGSTGFWFGPKNENLIPAEIQKRKQNNCQKEPHTLIGFANSMCIAQSSSHN